MEWVISLLLSHFNFQSVSLAHFKGKIYDWGGLLIDRLTYFIPGDFILIKHWYWFISLRSCTICCYAWVRLNLIVSYSFRISLWQHFEIECFLFMYWLSPPDLDCSFGIFDLVTPVWSTDGNIPRIFTEKQTNCLRRKSCRQNLFDRHWGSWYAQITTGKMPICSSTAHVDPL